MPPIGTKFDNPDISEPTLGGIPEITILNDVQTTAYPDEVGVCW